MSKGKKVHNIATSIGFKYPEKIPTPEDCLRSIGSFEDGITPKGVGETF
jgi:hypothetical protein